MTKHRRRTGNESNTLVERARAETALEQRVVQQAAVAALGQTALAETSLDHLMDQVVHCVADTLGTEFAKVLQLLPGGETLLLRAGVGWAPGLVGRAIVDAERGSQAGFTLLLDQPVVVTDLRAEARFTGPPLLVDHGVTSGMSCAIRGVDGRPYGVLGTHTRSRREFSVDDVNFLRSVANVLAAAIGRLHVEEVLRESQARQAYLVRLDDALRPLADAGAIQNAAARVLGEYVRATRAMYADVEGEPGAEVGTVRSRYHGDDGQAVAPFPERYAYGVFGEHVMALRRRGETMVVADVTADPRFSASERAAWVANGVRGAVTVSLVKDGRMVADLGIESAAPRAWTAHEIALVEATAERTWAALERARAEAALRESEERMQLAMRATRMVTWEWLPSEDRITTSDSFAALYGLPALTGAKNGFALVLPEDREKHLANVQRVATEGGSYTSEFRIRRPDDGQVVWLEERGDAQFDAAGRVERVIGITLDITERKRAEEALRKSEAMLASLFDALPVAAGIIDADGKLVVSNQEMNRYLPTGTIPSRDADRAWRWQAAHADGRPVDPADYPGARAIRGERVVPGLEFRYTQDDGTEMWAQVAAVPLRSADGRITGQVVVINDIDNVKRAEQALRESKAREEANRLKDEFLANMSHELRTPLNAIIGFADLMYRGKTGPVAPEQHEYLGDILTSSRHLLRLIDDILDLARIEAGKMAIRPEPVDLAQLTAEVRDVVRALAASKRLDVEVEVDEDARRVSADPARIKQILYNFLSNALKFTPEGGHVAVRIAPEGPSLFRIDVEDTGIGIHPEHLGKLFVEFQQIDAGAAKRHQGTGLGLALTRRIAEAHGGRVAVRSTPGVGSTFSAILPRTTPPSAPPS